MLNKKLNLGDHVVVSCDIHTPVKESMKKLKKGTTGILFEYGSEAGVVFKEDKTGNMSFIVRKVNGITVWDISGLLDRTIEDTPAQIKMKELQSYMRVMQSNLFATQRQVNELQKEINRKRI